MDLQAARDIAAVASTVIALGALAVSALNYRKLQGDRSVRLRLSWFERLNSENTKRYLVIRFVNTGRKVEIEQVRVVISEHVPDQQRLVWVGPLAFKGRSRQERDVEMDPPVQGSSLEVLPHATLDLSTLWPVGRLAGVRVKTRCGFERLFRLPPVERLPPSTPAPPRYGSNPEAL